MFEVFREPSQNDFEIRAYYISQTVKEPFTIEHLKLDKCMGVNDFNCKFSNFASYLRPFENLTWSRECGMTNFDALQVAEDTLGES